MYQIVRREQFSPLSFLWDVFAPDVAAAAAPGQFVMVRLDETGERIPLTIADFDERRGTITMVVQALGKTTREMMTRFREGDWFLDFAGPLGAPAPVERSGTVVLVGGGLGVAPIYPQLRALKEAGNHTIAILGFRARDRVFWEDRFRALADELIVCTDDGSYGRPGLVTAALEEVCRRESRPDKVIAIGPMPMMRACAELTRPFGVSTWVSLNAVMVDGTGMCGSCRVRVGEVVKFACVDGPDFDAHQVDFDELMARQRRFATQETAAAAEYERTCKVRAQLFDQGQRNYKKLKQIELTAHPMPEREPEVRVRSFAEVGLGYPMQVALQEAERCIQCRNPPCVSGCPVGIDIPGFIRHLLVRDLRGALETIHESNLFPSICGRVCPQESQCEAQCILAKKMEPVAIGRLERFVGDHAPAPLVAPIVQDERLGKVAIVGSGPAGLACAGDLARAGVEVVVYEALHVVGGVLQYGIPRFRLPRESIATEIRRLEAMGVRFETNKIIGRTFTLEKLLGELGYSALFIGTGAGTPVFLGLEGESAGRVLSANEFLTRVNLMGGEDFPNRDTPVDIGDRVVVLGAGNTAMDCLRTSRRLGARHVHCVYRRSEAEAPARVEELRHAREEGIEFHFLRAPRRILTDAQGAVTGVECQVMRLGPPDESGRSRPEPVEGSVETIACETVIYALGTRANPLVARSEPRLGVDRRGYVEADARSQATTMPGVFAGGDIVTGGATVILALGAGRRAARAILRYLGSDRAWPPPPADELEVRRGAGLACPRCHRPVEDDESYVCCAGTALAWSCDGCGRRYEGFAFPFGRCAACGGELTLADGSGAHGSTRAIAEAFEIELGGIAFYERGAAEARDAELRELFLRLAAMEREHLATLSRRYHVEAPPREGMSLAATAVFAEVELPAEGSGEDLLGLAVELERRARRFFTERVRALVPDGVEWRLYRELEAEEYAHVAMLETELEQYRRGRLGLLAAAEPRV